MQEKIRVVVLYGGRSGEHEISLQSGASVIRHLDKNRFEIIPISINKEGKWQSHDLAQILNSKNKELPIFPNSPEITLLPQKNGKAMLSALAGSTAKTITDIDVVFPVLHGPLCEDGTVQGLLELANVAYVGSGVLGSAIGMDKDIAKRLAHAAGIPVVPYLCARKVNFERSPQSILAQAKKELSLPLFVKPVNMGSSVGVHKVKRWEDLEAALRDAFLYDEKALLEVGIAAREIELAVLSAKIPGDSPKVSVPGEIIPSGGHEFYSYEAKYQDESGALLKLPADLSPEQIQEAQRLALLTFQTLECSGMARVDLFLDKDTNKFYLNEVNTIPGFTSISMYPKMMEASGVPYQELLSQLIDGALALHARKQALHREFLEA